MRDDDEAWIYEIIDVHSCMSKALFQQLILTENEARRAQLKRLLNEIDRMDSLVDCGKPSLKKYQLVCQAFFASLEHLQLAALMVEKIQKSFAEDHLFLRVILPLALQNAHG